MSRTYRHHHFLKDSVRYMKKYANKAVRNADDVPNGKQYRKFFNSYDICDWIYPCDWAFYKTWNHDICHEQKINGKLVWVTPSEKYIHDQWLREYHYR